MRLQPHPVREPFLVFAYRDWLQAPADRIAVRIVALCLNCLVHVPLLSRLLGGRGPWCGAKSGRVWGAQR